MCMHLGPVWVRYPLSLLVVVAACLYALKKPHSLWTTCLWNVCGLSVDQNIWAIQLPNWLAPSPHLGRHFALQFNQKNCVNFVREFMALSSVCEWPSGFFWNSLDCIYKKIFGKCCIYMRPGKYIGENIAFTCYVYRLELLF